MTVEYDTSAGTATAGTDYTVPSGTLTLSAGASSGTIGIDTLSATVLDRGETLMVTLSGASTTAGEVTADTTPAETTIVDEGTVTVSGTSVGAVAEGSSATVHGVAVGRGIGSGDGGVVDVARDGDGGFGLHGGGVGDDDVRGGRLSDTDGDGVDAAGHAGRGGKRSR